MAPGEGLVGGGRLGIHASPSGCPLPPAVGHFGPMSQSQPGVPGARGPSTGNMGPPYPLIPARSRTKSRMSRTGSRFPGQFGLLARLAAEVLQKLGIDLVGDSRLRGGARPNRPAWRRGPRRCPGRRVLPQSAVFEDHADSFVLVGLDEGDDLHGPAALEGQQPATGGSRQSANLFRSHCNLAFWACASCRNTVC